MNDDSSTRLITEFQRFGTAMEKIIAAKVLSTEVKELSSRVQQARTEIQRVASAIERLADLLEDCVGDDDVDPATKAVSTRKASPGGGPG